MNKRHVTKTKIFACEIDMQHLDVASIILFYAVRACVL